MTRPGGKKTKKPVLPPDDETLTLQPLPTPLPDDAAASDKPERTKTGDKPEPETDVDKPAEPKKAEASNAPPEPKVNTRSKAPDAKAIRQKTAEAASKNPAGVRYIEFSSQPSTEQVAGYLEFASSKPFQDWVASKGESFNVYGGPAP